MGAALSIAILFTISSTIVRVAGVFLEHTGIPRHIARIQAMSALSGTGFTTIESELLMQTNERRKILAMLMIAGSIGLASVVATLVVGIFNVHETLSGFFAQIVAIILAVVYIRFFLTSKRVDNFICSIANRWLEKNKTITNKYSILYQIDQNTILAEHLLKDAPPQDTYQWEEYDLIPLGKRSDDNLGGFDPWNENELLPGNKLILLGSINSHTVFSNKYGAILKKGH